MEEYYNAIEVVKLLKEALQVDSEYHFESTTYSNNSNEGVHKSANNFGSREKNITKVNKLVNHGNDSNNKDCEQSNRLLASSTLFTQPLSNREQRIPLTIGNGHIVNIEATT